MSNDAFQNLRHEVNLFREWAASYPPGPRSGEWECDYQGWRDIRREFETFLLSVPCREWNREITTDLLYIIARDNEMGELAEELAKDPERLLFMARASLAYSEYDARWQFAYEMSKLPELTAEVEAVLLDFVDEAHPITGENDPNEYTNRTAIAALARLKSPAAERLAIQAWSTGYQYQRMEALSSLVEIGSPLLTHYRQLAQVANESPYLQDYANRLSNNEPLA